MEDLQCIELGTSPKVVVTTALMESGEDFIEAEKCSQRHRSECEPPGL